MAIGNMGSTLNLIEGYLASEFAPDTYNRTQGTALLPDFVRQVASRADLTYNNLRVTGPKLFDGTNDESVETSDVGLIAVVAATNASASEDLAILFYETNPTEGTTRHVLALNVDAAGSTATGKVYSLVLPEPLAMAELHWSVVDNGADGDIEGTTLGDADSMKVMLVYAE